MAEGQDEKLKKAFETLLTSSAWETVHRLYLQEKINDVANILVALPLAEGESITGEDEIRVRRLSLKILTSVFSVLAPRKEMEDSRKSFE